MRGTPAVYKHHEKEHGIIPAYAGNTKAPPWHGQGERDHPRICGEHWIERDGRAQRMGSSPHMRGTRTATPELCTAVGIIPAYAGNTVGFQWDCAHPRDHPRICGEHHPANYHPPRQTGSSPHMRGTLQDRRPWRILLGIIPAYAGNTFVVKSNDATLRDHPRICGEHSASQRVGAA